MDIDEVEISIGIGDRSFEDTVADGEDVDRVATLLAFLIDTEDSVSLLDRLRSMENRVEDLDDDIGGVQAWVDDVDGRLENVESEIDENNSMFRAVADKLEELEQDVSSVQSRIDDGWSQQDGSEEEASDAEDEDPDDRDDESGDDSDKDGSTSPGELDIVETGDSGESAEREDDDAATADEPTTCQDDDTDETEAVADEGFVESIDEFRTLSDSEQDQVVVDVLSEVEPAAVTAVGSVLLGRDVESQSKAYAETHDVLESLRGRGVVDREREGRTYHYRVVDASVLDEDDSDSGDEQIDDAAGEEGERGSDDADSEASDDAEESVESSEGDGVDHSGSDSADAEVLNSDELDDGVSGGEMADHAKEPVSFQRAQSRKRGGHYLRCFQCGEDFDKLGFAEDHHEDTGHDEWLVRLKSLRQAGVYDAIDEDLEYPDQAAG